MSGGSAAMSRTNRLGSPLARMECEAREVESLNRRAIKAKGRAVQMAFSPNASGMVWVRGTLMADAIQVDSRMQGEYFHIRTYFQ